MTLKIIGAVMILCSCAGVGIHMAASYRREERILESLVGVLLYMKCELQYKRSSLPALCENVVKQTVGPIKQLFAAFAQELDGQISPDAQSCMCVAIGKCRGLPLQAIECLESLGSTLGIFDVEGQASGFDSAVEACERRLTAIRSNKDARLRGYKTLGLCAGAALVILFI